MLLLFSSCKPENMTSGIGEHPPGRFGDNIKGMDESEEFYRSVVRDGLAETVDSSVSGDSQYCPRPISPVPLEALEGSTIDEIVDEAYAKDPSCKKVFTGNKGDYAYPNKAYARTYAFSMAQDMCTAGAVQEVLSSPPMGPKDALSLPHFAKTDTSNDHLVATYALTFSLGMRESNGNFGLGRDRSASNTGIAEEVGLTQTSPNSLHLKGKPGTASEFLLREIFRSYINDLSKIGQAEKASLCLNDKLANSSQNKNFDIHGGKLHELFESGSCKGVDETVNSSIKFLVSNSTTGLNSCFRTLHQQCPGFSIKYGAAVARIRRDHHGPLYLKSEFSKKAAAKYFKPYLKPACHLLFNSLVNNKENICKDIKKTEEAPKEPSPLVKAMGEVKKTDYLALPSQTPKENPFQFKQDEPGRLLRTRAP